MSPDDWGDVELCLILLPQIINLDFMIGIDVQEVVKMK